MNGETRVALLTPPGSGAIATIAVVGPRGWETARRLFHPAGKPLPETPTLHRFWFGTLGEGVGDEVILAVTALAPDVCIEVHCHGGVRVVRWVIEQFIRLGCIESPAAIDLDDPWQLLTRATTLRTAAILLDQANGAFARSLRHIQGLLATNPLAALAPLRELARYAPLGRHLVEPWKVVIAGPPNVGKSSLVNALAGYQRAIVSEVAGTTRDIVTASLAFDGWPVELTDTAGLRDATGLEAEGIERARRILRSADVIVWVLDASEREPAFPDVETAAHAQTPANKWIYAMNKSDRAGGHPEAAPPGTIQVSALAGTGVAELIAAIVAHIARDPPPPGAALPYTGRLCAAVEAAYRALEREQVDEVRALLDIADCRTSSDQPPPYQ